MDEAAYQHLADRALKRIEDALKDVDADDVDWERAGDVLTLTFKSGVRCVVNTQRPTRQMWLAANARAWHFGWEAGAEKWLDDKGQKGADGAPLDLFGAVARIVRESAGIELPLS
jgi:CyaY protein